MHSHSFPEVSEWSGATEALKSIAATIVAPTSPDIGKVRFQQIFTESFEAWLSRMDAEVVKELPLALRAADVVRLH